MNIQIDSREKARAIQKIIAEFDRQGHNRFRDEMLRAREHGIRMIILCEHGQGIECLEDVIWWANPRRHKRFRDPVTGRWTERETKATTGDKLYKILCTFQSKYGCRFLFCEKKDTGRRIVELLSGDDYDE